jgi:uncharacterized membrane protein
MANKASPNVEMSKDNEMENLNNNDPSHWKWGLFYYNKNDKRIFPPKRIKQLGWTINFANPFSILTFIAILVLLWIVLLYTNGF